MCGSLTMITLHRTPVLVRHGHRNMEILTLMLEGTLTHRDSMGNLETLRAGEYQLMSAGRGVMYSEMNAATYRCTCCRYGCKPNETKPRPLSPGVLSHEDGFG